MSLKPTDIILEKVKIALSEYLSEEALQEATLKGISDYMASQMRYHFKTYILGEKVRSIQRTVTFDYPANWKEHLKYQFKTWKHCPSWLSEMLHCKFKQKKETLEFSQIECFPKMHAILSGPEKEYQFTHLKSDLWDSEKPFIKDNETF